LQNTLSAQLIFFFNPQKLKKRRRKPYIPAKTVGDAGLQGGGCTTSRGVEGLLDGGCIVNKKAEGRTAWLVTKRKAM